MSVSDDQLFEDGWAPDDVPAANRADRLIDAVFGFGGGDWRRLASRAVGAASPMGSLAGYRLIQELGRGGQGSVYKAVQPGTGRIVAIKRLGSAVLLGERQDERFRERYRAEIEALTRLQHPSIVTAHAAEVLEGHPVLVMEFVDGEPIDHWADAQWGSGAGALRTILECFLGVCEGVSHAHQRGVIHRDLKPTNIMVGRGSGAPSVKVLDFGVARLLDACSGSPAATLSGFVGTPAYASPEQLANDRDRVDTRSDVYSLGLLLYRLLSGREPRAPGITGVDLLANDRRIERPSRARPCLSRELDLIVLKATRAESAQRYQFVDALADDVRRFLAGRPIVAHPPGRAYVVRKFARRHRAACAVGVVATVAILSLALVSTAQAWRLGAKSRDLAAALRVQQLAARVIERARARAQAQEEIALEEGERQRRTSEFLLGLVGEIASGSSGRVTIPIEQLADWIEGPLRNAPGVSDAAVLARLHLGVATMRSAAGRSDLAAAHDRDAIRLLEASGDPALRARALIQLSSHQGYRGPESPALATARGAVAAIEAAGLSDTPLAIDALRQLSIALVRGCRRAESFEPLERALEIANRAGLPAETRAAILSDMASRWYGAGDEPRCVDLARASLACIPDDAGSSCEARWPAMVTLGMAAFRAGRLEESEHWFALASDAQKRALGDGHIRTRNAMRWHARALHELGRYDQAAAILERLLQLVPPSYEAVDPGTWQVRFRYAATLLGQGREQEANRQMGLAITRGGSRTPEDLAGEVERARGCLERHGLRFSPAVRRDLGDLAWLVDQVTGGAELASRPGLDRCGP